MVIHACLIPLLQWLEYPKMLAMTTWRSYLRWLASDRVADLHVSSADAGHENSEIDGEDSEGPSREPSGFFRGFRAINQKPHSSAKDKKPPAAVSGSSSITQAASGDAIRVGQPESSAGSGAGPMFGEPGYVGFGSITAASSNAAATAVHIGVANAGSTAEEVRAHQQQQQGMGNSRGLY